MKYPDYVVVDTQDGAMFGKDAYGQLWQLGSAVDFVNIRNRELVNQTYKIYSLTEITDEDITNAAEQQQESRYGGDGSFADNH